MPGVAHAERIAGQELGFAGVVLGGDPALSAAGHLHLVEAELATLPGPAIIPEITSKHLAVAALMAHGQTINQIRKHDQSLSRGDVRHMEKDLRETLGVPTTAAVVNQLVIHGIMSVKPDPDSRQADRLTQPDRSTLRSYAAGRVPSQIARGLGMAVPDFIEYEKGLHKKVGAWTRPHSVLRGHQLGVLRLVEASSR